VAAGDNRQAAHGGAAGIAVFEKYINSDRLPGTCFGQPLVEKAMEGFFNGLLGSTSTRWPVACPYQAHPINTSYNKRLSLI